MSAVVSHRHRFGPRGRPLGLAWMLLVVASAWLGGCSRCGAQPDPVACEDGQTREREPGCGSCTCADARWVCSTEACTEPDGSVASEAQEGAAEVDESVSCRVDPECRVSGCSNEVCARESVQTACLFDPTFACYREPLTRCGCVDGQCGWRPSAALDACVASGGEGAPVMHDQGPTGDGPPGPGGLLPGPTVDRLVPDDGEATPAP